MKSEVWFAASNQAYIQVNMKHYIYIKYILFFIFNT